MLCSSIVANWVFYKFTLFRDYRLYRDLNKILSSEEKYSLLLKIDEEINCLEQIALSEECRDYNLHLDNIEKIRQQKNKEFEEEIQKLSFNKTKMIQEV